jgi:hypothetical protein
MGVAIVSLLEAGGQPSEVPALQMIRIVRPPKIDQPVPPLTQRTPLVDRVVAIDTITVDRTLERVAPLGLLIAVRVVLSCHSKSRSTASFRGDGPSTKSGRPPRPVMTDIRLPMERPDKWRR